MSETGSLVVRHCNAPFGPKTLIEVYPGRREWVGAKRYTVGSSDAAALLMLSPFESPLSTYWKKKNGPADGVDNQFTAAGRYLEPAIARMLRDVLGAASTVSLIADVAQQYAPGFKIPHPMFHQEGASHLTATPDGIVTWRTEDAEDLTGDPRNGGAWLLEIKNTSVYQADKWADGPPAFVNAQVQHQMLATGINRCIVAVLIGGYDFRWYLVHEDKEIQEAIEVEARLFVDALESDNPPRAMTDSDAEYISLLYGEPEISGKTTVLGPDIADIDQRLQDSQAAMLRHNKIVSDCRAQIMEAMRGVEEGTLPDGSRYTFKFQERAGYVKEVKPSKFRVLRRIPAKKRK